jgi:hypothetical protein
MSRLVFVILALAACSTAAPVGAEPAKRKGDGFLGWSPDGTYWAKQWVGDGSNSLVKFCQTRASVLPSWPKELGKPVGDERCAVSRKLTVEAVKKMVSALAPAPTGPNGEKVTVKWKANEGDYWDAVVTVSLDGKKVGSVAELNFDKGSTVAATHWLSDGSSVAITFANNDEESARSVLVLDLSTLKSPRSSSAR